LKPHRVILALVPKKFIGHARRARTLWQTRRARSLISPDAVDCKSLLPPPPPDDSDQTRVELLDVLRLQETRTDEEVQRAIHEALISPMHFSEVLGDWFNSRNVPYTMKFLHDLMLADAAIVEPTKQYFGRKRPYQVDPRVRPCVPLENSAGYPSGHAARTLILARTLSHIFPDHAGELEALSNRIPHYRIKAGVHFPSDIEAGKIAGALIFEKMCQGRPFQNSVRRASEECGKMKPR
jgi:acid phosphatase (class A)